MDGEKGEEDCFLGSSSGFEGGGMVLTGSVFGGEWAGVGSFVGHREKNCDVLTTQKVL